MNRIFKTLFFLCVICHTTVFCAPSWNKYKSSIIAETAEIPGWYSKARTEKLIDFIHDHEPEVCVEIGVFAGSTTYPIASTLRYLEKGTYYAIDAWNTSACLEGLDLNHKETKWWSQVDLHGFKVLFNALIEGKNLTDFVIPIQMRSDEAVDLFFNESIDLLFIDGNSSYQGSLLDAMLYLPKVKSGGYIWLNSAHIPSKKAALEYLSEHCQFIKEESIGRECLLFMKP